MAFFPERKSRPASVKTSRLTTPAEGQTATRPAVPGGPAVGTNDTSSSHLMQGLLGDDRQQLDLRRKQLATLEQRLMTLEQRLITQEQRLVAQEHQLAERDQTLAERERALISRQAELDARFTDLSASESAAQRELADTRAAVDAQRAAVVAERAAVAEERRTLDALHAEQLNELQVQRDRLHAAQAEIDTQRADLARAQADSTRQQEAYVAKLAEREAELASQASELATRRGELDHRQAELAESAARQDAAWAERESALLAREAQQATRDADLRTRDADLRTRDEERAQAQQQLEADREQLGRELADLARTRDELAQQRSALAAERSQLDAKHSQLEAERQQLGEQSTLVDQRAAELAERVDGFAAQLADVEQRESALQARVAAHHAAAAEHARREQNTLARHAELEQQLIDQQGALDDRQKQLDDRQRVLDVSAEQLAYAQAALAASQGAAAEERACLQAEHNARTQTLAARAEELAEEREAIVRERQVLADDIARQQQQLAAQQAELEQQHAANQARELELKQWSAELYHRQHQLQEEQARLNEAERVMSADRGDTSAALQQAIAARDTAFHLADVRAAELAALQDKLATVEQQAQRVAAEDQQRAVEELAAYRAQVEQELRQRRDALEQDLARTETQLRLDREHTAERRRHVEQLLEHVGAATRALADQREELAVQQRALEAMQESLAARESALAARKMVMDADLAQTRAASQHLAAGVHPVLNSWRQRPRTGRLALAGIAAGSVAAAVAVLVLTFYPVEFAGHVLIGITPSRAAPAQAAFAHQVALVETLPPTLPPGSPAALAAAELRTVSRTLRVAPQTDPPAVRLEATGDAEHARGGYDQLAALAEQYAEFLRNQTGDDVAAVRQHQRQRDDAVALSRQLAEEQSRLASAIAQLDAGRPRLEQAIADARQRRQDAQLAQDRLTRELDNLLRGTPSFKPTDDQLASAVENDNQLTQLQLRLTMFENEHRRLLREAVTALERPAEDVQTKLADLASELTSVGGEALPDDLRLSLESVFDRQADWQLALTQLRSRLQAFSQALNDVASAGATDIPRQHTEILGATADYAFAVEVIEKDLSQRIKSALGSGGESMAVRLNVSTRVHGKFEQLRLAQSELSRRLRLIEPDSPINLPLSNVIQQAAARRQDVAVHRDLLRAKLEENNRKEYERNRTGMVAAARKKLDDNLEELGGLDRAILSAEKDLAEHDQAAAVLNAQRDALAPRIAQAAAQLATLELLLDLLAEKSPVALDQVTLTKVPPTANADDLAARQQWAAVAAVVAFAAVLVGFAAVNRLAFAAPPADRA